MNVMQEQIQFDFFSMLDDEENKRTETKESKKDIQYPKDEKVSKTKEKAVKKANKEESKAKDSKKNKKYKNIDEEIEHSTGQAQVIAKYLLILDGMKEKMEHPDVSVNGMFEYVMKQARKQAVGGCAMVADDVVYGWGRHYYDEHGKVAE